MHIWLTWKHHENCNVSVFASTAKDMRPISSELLLNFLPCAAGILTIVTKWQARRNKARKIDSMAR